MSLLFRITRSILLLQAVTNIVSGTYMLLTPTASAASLGITNVEVSKMIGERANSSEHFVWFFLQEMSRTLCRNDGSELCLHRTHSNPLAALGMLSVGTYGAISVWNNSRQYYIATLGLRIVSVVVFLTCEAPWNKVAIYAALVALLAGVAAYLR